MTLSKLFPLAAAALALGACDARFGNDATAAAASNGSAENKAEDGRLTISTPGFDMKINIPDAIRREARINEDSGLIYPNSQFTGIHVEGGRTPGAEGSGGEVEMRFGSADAPDLIGRWYRDPARAADFTVATADREGDAMVIAGTTKDQGRFRVRLSPRQGGGTDARIVISDAG